MPDDMRYTLTELAELAGVTPRTVRFYLSQGLIPSPGVTGPGVTYGAGSLDRLRLIRRLQREHLPLADIRRQLAGLDDEQIAGLVAAATGEGPSPTEPADTALDYVRRILAPPMAHPPIVHAPSVQAPSVQATSLRPPMPQRSLLKRIETVAEAPAPYAAAPSVAAPLSPSPEPTVIERSQWSASPSPRTSSCTSAGPCQDSFPERSIAS
jgi:DNA-binding transcriptional MerR regulator